MESKEGKEKGKNKQTSKKTKQKNQCQRNKQGEIVYYSTVS
jgi:hypothetical protein